MTCNLELTNGYNWIASSYKNIKELSKNLDSEEKLKKVGIVKTYNYWLLTGVYCSILYRARRLPILTKEEAEEKYDIIIED